MYKINPEYRNSRRINYNRWSEAPEVEQLVELLIADIVSRERGIYRNNMKVLILDLLHSFNTDPQQYIYYYRDSNHYDFMRDKFTSGDRYTDNPHISFDGLTKSVDALRAAGLIVHSKGGNFYTYITGEYTYLSRMRATLKLVELWRKYNVTPDMIGKFREDEVIILRDKETEEVVNKGKANERKVKVKKQINYKETRETTRMRKVVRAYNKQLEATYIDCDAACMSDEDRQEIIEKLKGYDKKRKPEIRIKLLSKSVKRVFNNRSFKQGGRFYGAWWVECPSVLRKYITIDGEPTVELDYSGIHIHLLYAMRGINYAATKADPYALDDGIPDRELNKLILLTALNAKTEAKARDAVYNELREDKKLIQYNLLGTKAPISEKLRLLKQKHAPISDMIASGEGIKLQYLDSCIIEKLITYGIDHNIPILTIHDSVICQAKYQDFIQDRMWKLFTDRIDKLLNFKITYQNSSPMGKHLIRGLADSSHTYTPPVGFWRLNSTRSTGIQINQGTLRSLLRPDELIKIKTDRRSNTCSNICNHSNRVRRIKEHKRCYQRVIKVELIKESNEDMLNVKEY